MLNSLAAKLHHKSLCVKDLNVKFCLQKLQIFVPFPLMENEPKKIMIVASDFLFINYSVCLKKNI